MDIIMKTCTKCGKEKPASEFHKNNIAPDGRTWQCADCRNAHVRQRFKDPVLGEKRRLQTLAYRRAHPDKAKISSKNWRLKNREWNSERRLIFRYGINKATFDKILLSQGNKCPICGTANPPTRNIRKPVNLGWAVDHDHNTGKVRGILCHQCNRGLGQLGDNLERAKRAVAYLEDMTFYESR